MQSNLDKYKSDLNDLVDLGGKLDVAIQLECFPEKFEKHFKEKKEEHKFSDIKKILPSFRDEYQKWYSEALILVKQLLPNRLNDFVRLYEKPKTGKQLSSDTYVIEDYLKGIQVRHNFTQEVLVGPDAAVPLFSQQLNIVKSIVRRFESSLFEIKQLVQADLFDSELDVARELLKNKFLRAAGAIAGVILEKPLAQVCANHNLKVTKKDPSISDLNDLLKSNNVIEMAQWRSIQYLGDLRNLCDHNKKREPTSEEVKDLINGVDKITKTLF